MSYNISSNNFDNKYLKTLLSVISEYFVTKGIGFYVIGATARDIVIKQLTGNESRRKTRDLDIAIAIDRWDLFDEISLELSSYKGFVKSAKAKQRFIYEDVYELDLVPFGDIAKDDKNIYWPPEELIAMSIKGFSEALKDAMTIRIDDEFDIKVASLSGLFLLKLNAWCDRSITTSKDADDMIYIIDSYFDAYFEHYSTLDPYNSVFLSNDFDTFVAGAIWLAIDLVQIIDKELLPDYLAILTSELAKNEDSKLLEQMNSSTSLINYDRIRVAIEEIVGVLKSPI